MRKDILGIIFFLVLVIGPLSRLTIAGWFFAIGIYTIIVFGLIHILFHLEILRNSSKIDKSFALLITLSHILYLCLFLFQSDAGDDKGYVVVEQLIGEFEFANLDKFNWIIFFTSLGLYLLTGFLILFKLKKANPTLLKKRLRYIVLSITGVLIIPIGVLFLISYSSSLNEMKKDEQIGKYENLRRALRNKGRVIYLRLYKYPNSYKNIPSAVFQLYNLENLEMYSNEIKEIPTEIASLKQLKSIDLQYNQIKNIPNELYSLPNLEKIVLLNNFLDSISPEICNCSNLKELYIGGPSLVSVPHCLSKLPKLEKLVVQSDSINNYMEVFSEFKTLKDLSLFTYQNIIRDNKKYISLMKKLPNTKIDIPSVILNQEKSK